MTVIILLAAALTACGSEAAPSAAVPAETAPPVVEPSPVAEATGPPKSIPTPKGQARADYLAALKAIDPGLVAKKDRAVARGVATCRDVRDKDAETAAQKVLDRFGGGDVELTIGAAREIVRVTQEHVCPDL